MISQSACSDTNELANQLKNERFNPNFCLVLNFELLANICPKSFEVVYPASDQAAAALILFSVLLVACYKPLAANAFR